MTLPDHHLSPPGAADGAGVASASSSGGPPPYDADAVGTSDSLAASAAPPLQNGIPAPPPGFAPFPVWLVPAWPPGSEGAQGHPAGYGWPMPMAYPAMSGAAAQVSSPLPSDPSIAHNQRLLILGIVAAVFVVHLPWLLYLFATQGCWGSFIDMCGVATSGDVAIESLNAVSDTPFFFARIAFFMLRVQAVLSSDWAQFSQVLQVSTGLGSFLLTKIIAANGKIAQGNVSRLLLAGTAATAFLVLFWAEIHLTGSGTYPALGDLTVLAYIDQELPEDFVSAVAAKSGLMQYLQILRLADALILGAALAMPKSSGKAI